MIQDKVKDQLSQLKKQGDKLQAQVNQRLEEAKLEGQRILKELGVESTESLNLKELVAELREANPSVKELIRKLDVATYDNRFRINWNSNMISSYAKQQAEKTYFKEIKPKLAELKTNIADQVQVVQEKTNELRAKIGA